MQNIATSPPYNFTTIINCYPFINLNLNHCCFKKVAKVIDARALGSDASEQKQRDIRQELGA